MPNAYVLNQMPSGYGHALSLLAEMLVGAGWQYLGSGDGASGYSATGKIFSGISTGPGGWGNARAWARLGMGAREIVVQHNAAGGFRLKYSSAAKFIGGTPSANTTPSAVDERYIQGGATDATPTYCTAYYSTGVVTGIDRFQGAALSGGAGGFWIAACRAGGATSCYSALMMDPVTSVPEDPDPVVWYACKASQDAFKTSGNFGHSATAPGIVAPGGSSYGSWTFMNASKTDFITVDAIGYVTAGYDGHAAPAAAGQTVNVVRGIGLNINPFNGKDDALPVPYGRVYGWQAPNGLKGWSTMARWTGLPRATFTDTLIDRQWVAVGNVWLPWDGVTPPIN